MAKTPSRPKPPQRPKTQEPAHSPNLALIIFLSLSMVINVALGVFMYLDKEKVTKAIAEKDAADKAKRLADTNRDLIRNFFVSKLRAVIGDPKLKPDEVSEMRTQNDAALALIESDKENWGWYKELLSLIGGDPGKQGDQKLGLVGPMEDPNQPGFVGGRTKSNFIAKMNDLQNQKKTLLQDLKTEQEKVKDLETAFNDYKNSWNPKKLDDSLKAQSDRSSEDLKKRIDEKDKVIDEYKDKLAALERQAAQELRKEKDRYEADITAKERAFKERVKELELSVKEELRKLQASQIVALNDPRGEITKVDPKGDQVYINIGSGSRLAPKVPFLVYGRGPAGAPRPVPKAKIEVIQSVHNDVALARVLEIRKVDAPYDPNTSEDPIADKANWITDPRDFWQARNPLQKGDLLFNPAWDPRRQVRVYLAGPFDLDGDGRDDVREIERLLSSYGVKVDGYLDPNTNYSPTGMLQYRTDFVVIGDVPEILADAKKGIEPKRAQGNEMLTQINKITQEAKDKGVEVISWKRFFSRIGYSPSRLPAAGNGNSGVGGRGYVGVTK